MHQDIAALAGFFYRGARGRVSRQYNRAAASLDGVAESLGPRAMQNGDRAHRNVRVAIYGSRRDFVHVDTQALGVQILQPVGTHLYCRHDKPA